MDLNIRINPVSYWYYVYISVVTKLTAIENRVFKSREDMDESRGDVDQLRG